MRLTVELQGSKAGFKALPSKAIEELDRILSFPVDGAWYARSYRMGKWDGKIHFIHLRRGGGYTVPIGFLPELLTALENIGIKTRLVDRRGKAEKLPRHGFKLPVKPRPYQLEAVEAVVQGKLNIEEASGLGILKMSIRSGKTIVAALLIERLGVRALFVVPSLLLLNQTVAVLERSFQGLPIGRIGEGVCSPSHVTVATFQSLMSGFRSKNKAVMETVERAGVLLVDECHHLEAEEWRRPLLTCPAKARVGFSATAYISRRKANERNALWLKAICGPIVYEVDMAYLVKRGWLVETKIILHKIEKPDRSDERWSASLYDELITDNRSRNLSIASYALKARSEGKTVLVDIGRIRHGENLLELLRGAGLRATLLLARTPMEERTEAIQSLRSGRLDVIISTLLGEGVDIPELEVVINAEGGASRKSTIQRLRNMTPAEGKTGATIVDFMDLTSPYLAAHSRDRLATYRSEGCFKIVVNDGRLFT